MLQTDIDYIVHDGNLLRFHLDYVVSKTHNIDVGQYLYGRCHLFAEVLARKLNLDFGFMINDEPGMDGDEDALPELNHAFCYKNKSNEKEYDYLIDARGLVLKEEVINDYTTHMFDLENNIEVVNPHELYREWMNSGLLCGFLKNEEKDIEDFIDLMIKYKFLDILEPEKELIDINKSKMKIKP